MVSLYDYCMEHGDSRLLDQWQAEKNIELTPKTAGSKSGKTVWWVCENGHEWKCSIQSRVVRGQDCPVCGGKAVESGSNDLKTCFPTLSEQWNYAKNGALRPENVLPTYSKKVWWCCERGHEWQCSVNDRVRVGAGCPVCSGRRTVAGCNDLATLCPEVAAQWHPTKNGTLRPSELTDGSSRKVWWQCEKGHEWQAKVNSRTRIGTGCPYCTGRKVESGFNDLAAGRPEVAAEWHPERNAPLTPDKVTVASNRKVWWRCQKGHEYYASIRSRTSQNSGCPYCMSKILLQGFNDLETLYPTVARQWHPTLNGSVTPDQVFPATNVKYWWICEEGHIWSATPASRTMKNRRTGCPVCSGNYKRSTLYKPGMKLEPPKGVRI